MALEDDVPFFACMAHTNSDIMRNIHSNEYLTCSLVMLLAPTGPQGSKWAVVIFEQVPII